MQKLYPNTFNFLLKQAPAPFPPTLCPELLYRASVIPPVCAFSVCLPPPESAELIDYEAVSLFSENMPPSERKLIQDKHALYAKKFAFGLKTISPPPLMQKK